ncbi:hypothetical protein Trydic_g20400 [Trypoxylus dichotomus]
MLILARNTLSLTRILLRYVSNTYAKQNLYPISLRIVKKLAQNAFYCTKAPHDVDGKTLTPEDIKVKVRPERNTEDVPKITVNPSMSSTIIGTVTGTESSTLSASKSEESDGKKQENSWQTMKYTFTIFGVTFTVAGLFLLFEFGAPSVNEDGEVIEDEYSQLSPPMQYIYRTAKQINYYRKLINEPSRDKLLPDELKYPYHQPPYTLVLEFKDVLVHPDWTYSTGWRFKKRPGIDQFLEMLNGIYEIVIYTAELGMTVFPILEALDPNNLITYKLVRDATNFTDGHHVKDLQKLNRNLSKVILVDWDGESVKDNKDNVLKIRRWNGDDYDTSLLDLANFLRVIAMSEIQDVRDVLSYYRQYEDPIEAFREKQKELERTMYNTK